MTYQDLDNLCYLIGAGSVASIITMMVTVAFLVIYITKSKKGRG